jgi:hypothetical protein
MNLSDIRKLLFDKKKDWDYAHIYCLARGPIAVEPTSSYELSENNEQLIIEDKQAPNPFYDPRRGNPDEPQTVHLRAILDTECITSIEFLKFAKIITGSKKIEVVK